MDAGVESGAKKAARRNKPDVTNPDSEPRRDRLALLAALQAMRRGDFSVRLPGDQTGIDGKIADTFNEIVASSPDDEFFDSKVTVLKEEIEHHVKEEEKQHDNMFQQARAADVDLDALGEKMLARKEELKAQAETAGLPPAETTTM